MRARLRTFLPLAIGMALLASLGATPVASQEEVTPAAGVNADRVDGLDAVKATLRANKLVATNKQGLLPSNTLRPIWSLKPAGFADGVDDAGVTGVKPTKFYGPFVSVPVNDSKTATADCPPGSRVTGGGFSVTYAARTPRSCTRFPTTPTRGSSA